MTIVLKNKKNSQNIKRLRKGRYLTIWKMENQFVHFVMYCNPLWQVGRTTTDDCGGSNADAFPSAHGGFEPTMDFFQKQFGLTNEQSIVLLGAHSLGAC